MFLTFDGRTAGQPREGYGTKRKPRVFGRDKAPQLPFEPKANAEEDENFDSVKEMRTGAHA
jgi:hypothetical protein